MHSMTAVIYLLAFSALVLVAHPARADGDATDAASAPPFAAALSDDLLAAQRGKALTIHNTNDLDASLYENSVIDVVTGANQVTDGSLANNAGLATVIQNSGNNVLIQNAVILNIQMQ